MVRIPSLHSLRLCISGCRSRRRTSLVHLWMTILGCLALTGSIHVSVAQSVDPSVTGNSTVDNLLAQMTLEEKLTLLTGATEPAASAQYQAGYLPGIPRLGIPSLRLADGAPGVVTRYDSTGMVTPMGVGATWSVDAAKSDGVVIGRDARALGQDLMLEPFLNVDRDTSWTKTVRMYGEDPYLVGQIGAANIIGIQSQGVMAQGKSLNAYVGPDTDKVVVDDQTLRELYFAPLQDAIDVNVASFLCSYRIINGFYSCDNAHNLIEILRNEAGSKGIVISDWGATHATTFINDGQDLEMPGGQFFSKANLEAAIAAGTVPESRIDEAVGRILYQYSQFGFLSGASKHDITPIPLDVDLPAVQQTAELAATLLKNDGNILPVSSASSIAFIGPGAGQTIATNGLNEKAGGFPSEQVGTYQVMQSMLGGQAKYTYAVGDDMTGTPIPASVFSYNGQPGLQRTDNNTQANQIDSQVNFASVTGTALPAGAKNTWTGTLTIPATGSYWINLQVLGATGSVTLDGTRIANGSTRYGAMHATGGNGPLPTTDGLANFRVLRTLSAGPHSITITEVADITGNPVQVRLSWVTPDQQKANHDAAVTAAASANTVIVFAWSSSDLSNPLPEGQDQLIADIASVNSNTIVVLNTSQPVAMPWLGNVRGILEMWFPGDRGGYATANVLLGKVNPGGHLPVTWPAAFTQEPAQDPAHPERKNNQGHNGTTVYSEGLNIGYRYFDLTNQTPLYPFGYGLSYTSFSYSKLKVKSAADGGFDVSFRVTNSGGISGDTVPQIYLSAPNDPPVGVQFAPKALAAFTRVHLDRGQWKDVNLHVRPRQLQAWSMVANGWITPGGSRVLYLSTSARDDVDQVTVSIGCHDLGNAVDHPNCSVEMQ